MSTKLRRILCVDDDPNIQKVVKLTLEDEGYDVSVAGSGEEALHMIDHWLPHLILLDVNMPGLDGLTTLAKVRGRSEYISTIFLSGNNSTEDIVKGLDSGADDYICKPFSAGELLSRIRCQLRIKDIRDDLAVANERLKALVDIDDLTGLFNMRSVYSKLDHELERARRYQKSVCVLMMDMDNFKSVNDGQNHLFGSYVLAEIGHLVKMGMRKVDFAARYGGDEFLIVLTEIDVEGALIFAERLRESIENYQFRSEEFVKKVTASIGLAVTGVGDIPFDGRMLVKIADKALYRAKKDGRNLVRYIDCENENLKELDLSQSYSMAAADSKTIPKKVS